MKLLRIAAVLLGLGYSITSFAQPTIITPGSGAGQVANFIVASAALDFPSTNTVSTSVLTIALTGAALGDVVALGVPNGSLTPNAVYWSWVSAANTVTVRFLNMDLAAQDPASGTFKATILK